MPGLFLLVLPDPRPVGSSLSMSTLTFAAGGRSPLRRLRRRGTRTSTLSFVIPDLIWDPVALCDHLGPEGGSGHPPVPVERSDEPGSNECATRNRPGAVSRSRIAFSVRDRGGAAVAFDDTPKPLTPSLSQRKLGSIDLEVPALHRHGPQLSLGKRVCLDISSAPSSSRT